jgi:DNA-directed RNA polymerase specialized sigma24 family protein
MSGDKELFEDQWPALAQVLHRVLSSRGIRTADRDDIVQETALRLVRIWDEIDHSRPILPLATTIALNLLRSNARRKTNHPEVTIDETFDRPSVADVESDGLARLELSRVGRAMKHLNPSHRAVLLQEITDERGPADRGVAATKMLRMRARRRLTSLLETASVTVGLVVFRFRRSFDSITPTTVSAIAAASIIVAGLPGSAVPSGPALEVKTGRAVAQVDDVSPQRELRQLHSSSDVSEPASASVVAAAPATTRDEPVRVPLGDGGVEVQGEASVNDIRVEIKERGGRAPLCVGGIGELPEEMECPD